MSNKLDYINMIKKVSPYNVKKGIFYLRHYGARGFWIKLTERFQKSDIDYKEWYEKSEGFTGRTGETEEKGVCICTENQYSGTGI